MKFKLYLKLLFFSVIFLGSFLVSGIERASAATLQNPEQWGYQKKITISGTGSDEANYRLRLNVHYGSQTGDATAQDIYLDSKGKTDFSDGRFTLADGTTLTHYQVSAGNYEIIPDNSRLGSFNQISADGRLWASRVPGRANGLCVSSDNGTTWTQVTNGGENLLFIDAAGYIYIQSATLLKRSTTPYGYTFSTVYTLPTGKTIQWAGIAQDPGGRIFAGIYTDDASNYSLIIMSNDGGTTFSEVFGGTTVQARPRNTAVSVGTLVRPATPNGIVYICRTAGTTADADDDGTHPVWTTGTATITDGTVIWVPLQHVHGLNINPVSGYVYAGFDGLWPAIVRLTDQGTISSAVYSGLWGDVASMAFGNGWRLFGVGASGAQYGCAILYTTNDSTFTCALPVNQSIQGLKIINGNVYATGVSYFINHYASVYRSANVSSLSSGTWTAVWQGSYDPSAEFTGFEHVQAVGVPNGGENQIILGANNGTGGLVYPNSRLYDGGSHYQAAFDVIIPFLPAAGTNIYYWYGNSSANTASDIATYVQEISSVNPILWYKLDSNNGTVATDSSSNNKPGTITPSASGAWGGAVDGRRVGAIYPSIQKSGSYYNFGTGTHIRVDGSSADTTWDLTSNFTIGLWFKTTQSGTNQILISRGGTSSSNRVWGIGLASSNIRYFNGNNTTFYYTDLSPSTAVNDGNWHHIVSSFDGSNPPKVTTYIDGVLIAAQSLGYPISTINQHLEIGRDAGANLNFIGSIDDVRIYNTALTSTQARQIYEGRVWAGSTEAGRSTDTGTKLIFQDSSYGIASNVPFEINVAGVTVNNFTANAGIQVNEDCTLQNTIGWNPSGNDITIAAGKTVTGSHNYFQDSGKSGAGTYNSATSDFNSSNPLFLSTTNYQLQPISPAIDSGTPISGLTTDYLGNPIYGLPDIGAYEYQPTSNLSVSGSGTDNSIRVYGGNSFRNLGSTYTGPTISLDTNDTTKSLDITVSTWNQEQKQWIESSATLGSTNTTHTICNLYPNFQYQLKIDNTHSAYYTSNSNGCLTFTYTNGYSTHTFSLTAVPPDSGTPINNPAISQIGLPTQSPSTTQRPNNSLIQYANDFKVYVLEQGKKRWIKDEYTFNTLGYQWHNIQKIEASETYEDGETIVITSSPQSSPLKGEGGFTLNLKPGQTHEQVKLLQQYLNTHGYQLTLSGPGSPNNETSYFGPLTKQALLRFQKANGLKESGVVDEGVREVLNQ